MSQKFVLFRGVFTLKVKYHPDLKVFIIATIFFITLSFWTLWQFHFNYMLAANDTFFHAQRIYEIRIAFLRHQLPSWVNFNTFFNTGQAINGMYPDFTLWPFVLLTNFLTPIHQIIAIRTLIVAATFSVSFLSLNKRFDSQNAILAATIFALSGTVLKDWLTEMQTGSAIVMIFAFPLIFTLKNIVESDHFDSSLIIKTALLMTIVINSHLLSAVAITLITGIFLLIRSIIKKTYWPWINLIIATFLTIILSLPIIFRIVTISKTGLLAPFGQGHVLSDPLWKMFFNSGWASKSALSNVSLTLLTLTLLCLDKTKIRHLLPWIAIEITILIFCSDLIPWNILDHVPVINNFQVANWRFGLFLKMIPLILVLINFDEKSARLILLTITIIAYPFAFKIATTNQYHDTAALPLVTQYTALPIPQNQAAKLTSTGINSDKLIRTLVPDYAPKITPLAKNSGDVSLNPNLAFQLTNHLAQTKQHNLSLTHNSDLNSITFNGHDIPDGKITLPVFAYKSLHYSVTVNNQPVKWNISQQGFITLHPSHHFKTVHYKIKHLQPAIYPLLILLSLIIYSALVIYLVTPILLKLKISN